MTISYPLTMPSEPGVVRVRIATRTAVSISRSNTTYVAQIQSHPGQMWIADFTLPIMTRAQAEIWQAFLLQLDGPKGTFYLGDPFATAPRGNWAGAPKVNGASQTGQSLAIDGLASGATIEPGDTFQLGVRLYKYIGMTTAVANGSGQVTLDIWPRLRETPADNDALITISPVGLFRLSENSNDLYNSNAMEYYEVSVSAAEAI